ncbi:MAG: NYN domain-containing protein [Planctomycetota bacterium]
MGGGSGARRAVAFVDGQNLYHAAREEFGYTYPNYDPLALARAVCKRQGWRLEEVRFYTGVPSPRDDPVWCAFWSAKLPVMGRQGVKVFTRPLRRRLAKIRLPGGAAHTLQTREEKGIDVRIAIDVIRIERAYEVALLFSQDQDLSEVAREIRAIAREQGRWIKIACAYPRGEGSRKRPGIDLTDWIPIDRATYDACIDRRDYRPKGPGGEGRPG